MVGIIVVRMHGSLHCIVTAISHANEKGQNSTLHKVRTFESRHFDLETYSNTLRMYKHMQLIRKDVLKITLCGDLCGKRSNHFR